MMSPLGSVPRPDSGSRCVAQPHLPNGVGRQFGEARLDQPSARLCCASTSSTHVRPGAMRIGWPPASRWNGSVALWRVHVPSILLSGGVHDGGSGPDRLRLGPATGRARPVRDDEHDHGVGAGLPVGQLVRRAELRAQEQPLGRVPVPAHVVAADHHLGERHRRARHLRAGGDVLEGGDGVAGAGQLRPQRGDVGVEVVRRRAVVAAEEPRVALAEQLEPGGLRGRR